MAMAPLAVPIEQGMDEVESIYSKLRVNGIVRKVL